jgi:hypothetical protein
LANDDAERSAILEKVQGFYGTRSRAVHGDRLTDKHRARLSNIDDLRSLLRRLLRSLVHCAVHGTGTYTKQFFKEHLDAALVNSIEREALRRALSLA